MLSGFWINPRLNTTSLYSWTFIEFSFNSYAWYFELQEVCLHLRAWIIYKTTKWNKTHFWKTFMCMSRCHLLSVSSKLCLSLPESLGINICSFFLIRRRKLKYSLRRKKKKEEKALPRHLLSIRMTKHDKRPINDQSIAYYFLLTYFTNHPLNGACTCKTWLNFTTVEELTCLWSVWW